MARTLETAADIERQLRHEFSYLFDIDEDEIQLDTRIVDMPDFYILDWQAMASIVVDTFGATLSDEDFLQFANLWRRAEVRRKRSNTAKNCALRFPPANVYMGKFAARAQLFVEFIKQGRGSHQDK